MVFFQDNKIGSFIRASYRDCLDLFLALVGCCPVGLCIWVGVVVEGIVLAGRIAGDRVAVGGKGRVAVHIGAGGIAVEGTEGEEEVEVADVLG